MEQEIERLKDMMGGKEEELVRVKGLLNGQISQNDRQAKQYSQIAQEHIQVIQQLTKERENIEQILNDKGNQLIQAQE